jgi:membrane protease YdiL (CAAX protease family)
MTDVIKPAYAIVLIMLVPCIVGGVLARNRGRSIVGWGVLCAVFPIFLLVLYFKHPLEEVPGGFRRCGSCGEFIPWKRAACKYCGAEQLPRG